MGHSLFLISLSQACIPHYELKWKLNIRCKTVYEKPHLVPNNDTSIINKKYRLGKQKKHKTFFVLSLLHCKKLRLNEFKPVLAEGLIEAFLFNIFFSNFMTDNVKQY